MKRWRMPVMEGMLVCMAVSPLTPIEAATTDGFAGAGGRAELGGPAAGVEAPPVDFNIGPWVDGIPGTVQQELFVPAGLPEMPSETRVLHFLAAKAAYGGGLSSAARDAISSGRAQNPRMPAGNKFLSDHSPEKPARWERFERAGENARTEAQKLIGTDGRSPGPAGPPAAGEVSAVPEGLRRVYEALPDGGLRRASRDPAAVRLARAKTELWAVRHGESQDNRKGLLNGRAMNSPLTRRANSGGSSGRTQAASAARELYEKLGGDAWAREVVSGRLSPLVILSSPLLRARETAAALKRLLRKKAARLARFAKSAPGLFEEKVARELLEISYGEFTGLPLAAMRNFPFWKSWDAYHGSGRNFLARFRGSDRNGQPGESRLDVMLRQRTLLQRIAERYAGRTVVLFSHFETIAAQQAVLGLLEADAADGAMTVKPVAEARPILLSAGSSRASKDRHVQAAAAIGAR